MELDNFFLAEYDPRNIDHKTVIIKLENADRKDKHLGDLEYPNRIYIDLYRK